jgi:hypothetical protein
LRRAAGAAAVLATAALGLGAHASQPAGGAITIEGRALPFDREQPAVHGVGDFTEAGLLALTSADTRRLHGLSDLKVWPDGRLLAVGDEGDVLEARLALDTDGRLTGVSEARLYPLLGANGRPLRGSGKNEADSEGVAELADGDRLVSLERDDRILLYPKDGGPPRRVPSPDVKFPFNLGMEALDVDPEAGPDAYVVGAEASGQTWICRLSVGCTESARVAKPMDAGLSAVAVLPGGRRAYLIRSFHYLTWFRVTLRIVDRGGSTLDELRLAPPLNVDNYEGLAALPRPDGSVRFYLISDDNFSRLQQTLILALDWRPTTGRPP